MKKQLFLYLFIIAVLMNFFIFSFFNKQIQFEKNQTEKIKTEMNDTISKMNYHLFDANHFSLEQNDLSQNYFENYNISLLSEKVMQTLLNFNDSHEGNPYTGYEKMGNQKFIINKAKILNHRWIIADFSNGELWGEVLIQYFIEEDETVTFKILQTVLYPKQ